MSLWQRHCQWQQAAGKPTILAAPSLPGMFFRQIKAKTLVNQELFIWHGYCLGNEQKGFSLQNRSTRTESGRRN
jgi:hypothetical protein